jgi:uncharacterized repeat protein (TIGR01451 family)
MVAGNKITWNTGVNLDTNQKLTRTFTVQVNAGVANNTQIVNTAYVSATNESAVRTGTVTSTVQIPELTITKTASPSPVASGQPLNYTIVVKNTGEGLASGLVISDTVPVSTTLSGSPSDGGTPSGTTAGSKINWAIAGTLASNQSVTRTFTVVVASGLAEGSQISNTASTAASNAVTAKSSTVTTNVHQIKVYLPTVIKN